MCCRSSDNYLSCNATKNFGYVTRNVISKEFVTGSIFINDKRTLSWLCWLYTVPTMSVINGRYKILVWPGNQQSQRNARFTALEFTT